MEEPKSDEENKDVPNAKEVYLLMKRDYRISRNIRAAWYLNHLNSVITFVTPKELPDTPEELDILSVVPEDDSAILEPGCTYSFRFTPRTKVTFMSTQYRVAFALDLSPSVASVDLCSGRVLYDDIFTSLKNCLEGLVEPFSLPGSPVMISPHVYVTVVAYTPLITCRTNHVLAQGVHVTCENVKDFLTVIQKRLEEFENSLAQNFSRLTESRTFVHTEENNKIPGSQFDEDGEFSDMLKTEDLITRPEAGFVNVLRYGILALQLLQENTSAGIAVLTDGMVGLPDANMFETLLAQLRNSTFACSFLHIGSSHHCNLSFGHVPHTELMQFIAAATFGAYFAASPPVEEDGHHLNIYHRAFFLWSFQKGLTGFQLEDTGHKCSSEQIAGNRSWLARLPSHPITEQCISAAPAMRKKHKESNLHTSISNVLSLRLREGYTIKEVVLTKDECQIEVRLLLPWREYARIEYLAVAAWPLSANQKHSHIEITIEGSYEFLHEVTCTDKRPSKSPFRTVHVKKYWQSLQSLMQTDQLLVHLHSFASNPANHTIPESVKNGVPLFSQGSFTLEPQLQQDAVLSNFASFWNPVARLDINIWQKWMHTHRIGILMEHDLPPPKHLHTPNTSGRFHTVQCRQALASLTTLLHQWCTFVLMENHSYIKLVFSDPDKPPTSFYIIRMTSKPPCMVLHLAFLGGTPGFDRYNIVTELKQEVLKLRFPQHGTAKDRKKGGATARKRHTTGGKAVKVHSPPLSRQWSEINCCVVLAKPVEKILIRYERVPKDLTRIDDPSKEIPHHISAEAARASRATAASYNTLSRYLHHQRWIWMVQRSSFPPVSMNAVGRILSTLSKIRLQEGFHFAMTNNGIVNMVAEVEMKDIDKVFAFHHHKPLMENNDLDDSDQSANTKVVDNRCTCVVQYILFPPYVKTCRGSVSEEDLDELEATEVDGELQIVTECWVEPQHGIAISNPPERKHFDGLTCKEIASAFHPVDYECISCLTTFEHLIYLCQNAAAVSYLPSDLGGCKQYSPKKPYEAEDMKIHPSIQLIPFPYDLLSLLPRCQQAEMLFSAFIVDPVSHPKEDWKTPNNILFGILMENLRDFHEKELSLSHDDCQNFTQMLLCRKQDQSLFSTSPSLHVQTDFVDEGQETGSSITINEMKSNTSDTKEKQPDISNYPMWRCYVKAVRATHLFLTFVPTSFDDLLLLMKMSFSSDADDLWCRTGDRADLEDQLVKSAETVVHVGLEEIIDVDIKATEVCDDSDTPHLASSDDNVNVASTLQQQELTDDFIHLSENNLELLRKESYVIPIYVYDCSLSRITDSLVNKWSFSLPKDITDDHTFSSYCESENGEKNFSLKQRSFGIDDSDKSEERDDSSEGGRHSTMSLDRRSNDSICDQPGEFKQHRDQISEMFFNCYVTGIFKNLIENNCVDKQDFDAAINDVCIESLPLELDITSFLHAACGHLRQFTGKPGKQGEQETADVLSIGNRDVQKLSVRFMDTAEEQDSDSEGQTKMVTGVAIPAVLQLPHVKMSLPIQPLDDGRLCEYVQGLHQLIQRKFDDLLKMWFKPVPSCPEYYYYCPEYGSDQTQGETGTGEASELTETPNDSQDKEVTGDETDAVICEDGLAQIYTEKQYHNQSITFFESDSDPGSLGDSDNEVLSRTSDSLFPLFINFTCTIKRNLDHHSISVGTIPTCVGDITNTLCEEILELDLGYLKVTFDINCLTVPLDIGSPTKKPIFSRMFSNASGEDQEDSSSNVTSTDGGFRHIFGDPIGHLPKHQHQAIIHCKEEIDWMLRDEIVCALRHIYPITKDVLQMVTDHIQKSVEIKKSSCYMETVEPKFVFGPEQSLSMFLEEFERMNLGGYRLNKQDNYFFVASNRAMAHALALSSALSELTMGKLTCKTTKKSNPDLDEHRPSSEVKVGTFLQKSLFRNATNGPQDVGGSGPSVEGRAFEADISIQLTNANGRKEICRLSPERTALLQRMECSSRTSDTDEGVLKRSSSFGGFEAEECRKTQRAVGEKYLSTAPVKVAISASSAHLSRARHFSAPTTAQKTATSSQPSTVPQTPSWVSSRGSFTEEGYEGDSSDSNNDDGAFFSDAAGQKSTMPNFWLIMQVDINKVTLYFHTRGDKSCEVESQAQELLWKVSNNIKDTCKRVNQQFLLNDLYETHMCNGLLVPEADEDVSWKHDKMTIPGPDAQDDEDEEEMQEQRYLADARHFLPGHFACDHKWGTHFPLHPRLKTGTSRTGISRGMHALRTVLNKFSVNNRRNMFVIKDSDNVFYVKLNECKSSGTPCPEESGHRRLDLDSDSHMSSANLSPFSTTGPGGKLDDDEESTKSLKDFDTYSVTSTGSHSRQRSEDCIELSFHGISEVGKDIQEELVKVLQNRLDDAVLDVISLMLMRNPKCKLTPADVRFIQRRQQLPLAMLFFTVPFPAARYSFPLIYYLRQNLLQFLHVPNYIDAHPLNHFIDYANMDEMEIKENHVFLYNTPQSSGAKGIACVALAAVNSRNEEINFIDYQKPSLSGYEGMVKPEQYANVINTTMIQQLPDRGSIVDLMPFIRFRIWERGNGDLPNLKEMLRSAVRHALCDVILEFQLLTAPICQAPHSLYGDLQQSVHSEPTSPASSRDVDEKPPGTPRKFSMQTKFGKSSASPVQFVKDRSKIAGSLSPSSKESFKFSELFTSVSQGNLEAASLTRTEAVNMRDRELQNLIFQYERGDKGNLHPVFTTSLPEWLDYCYNLGVPSVNKLELTVQARLCIDFVLKELLGQIGSIASDIHMKIFKLVADLVDGEVLRGIPYTPLRSISTKRNSLGSTFDLDWVNKNSPGKKQQFLVVGRNVHQWYISVDHDDWEEEEFLSTRSFETEQKFASYMPLSSSEKTERSSESFTLGLKTQAPFAPRQRLLLLQVHDKTLTFYTYNCAGHVTNLLNQTITKLVHWQNARAHLLDCLVMQKMGLYHHQGFGDSLPRQMQNSFTQMLGETDLLIKYSAPPKDMHKRHNSMSASMAAGYPQMMGIIRPFDEIYRNLKPAKPMQCSPYFSMKDIVFRHGLQAQEIRNNYRKDIDKVFKLRELHAMWFQNKWAAISEDIIQLLKQSSRLLHYCATPILFSPCWRQKVLQRVPVKKSKDAENISPVIEKSENSRTRSRHSSGASIASLLNKRTDNQDGRRKERTSSQDTADQKHLEPAREQTWHKDLRGKFLAQYMQYLQSLGFVEIHTRPASPKRTGSRFIKKVTMDDRQGEDADKKKPEVYDLQKTLPGGILLFELSFRDQYYCVKLYGYDCTRTGALVNSQLRLYFIDECDTYQALTHIHSFAHDFHLRCILAHISGEEKLFSNDYHLTSFLTDFLEIYPSPPSFSRNYVHQDTIELTNLTCRSHQLFDYILNHTKLHDLRMICMKPVLDGDADLDGCRDVEFALVHHRQSRKSVDDNDPGKQKADEYNIGLIVTHDAHSSRLDLEQSTLKLHYHLVLTSKRELFPMCNFVKRLGALRSVGQVDAGEHLNQVIPVKQHIGVRPESIKTRSLSSVHQSPVHRLVIQEAEAAKRKIERTVKFCMAQCRRDILWERLVKGGGQEEDSRKKRKSDPEEGVLRLTFADFQELLCMVSSSLLSDLDERLLHFTNMGLGWFAALLSYLPSRYGDHFRYFVNNDCKLQYAVIVSPEFQDACILLTVNSQTGSADMSMLFRDAAMDETHPSDTVHYQVESFIGACCFHLWSSMI